MKRRENACVCVAVYATATRQLDSSLFRHNASAQMEKGIEEVTSINRKKI